MSIEIQAIPALKDNYIWLLINRETDTAICIDPGEAAPVVAYLEQQQLKLIAILITHHHWDHTAGIKELYASYACEIYGPQHEVINEVTQAVTAKTALDFKQFNTQFAVLETPGHTLGHVCYYSDDMLFCGDTLFTAGCGRVFEGTFKQMYDTLCKLRMLPDTTKIYCGHEYTVKNLQFATVVEPQNLIIQQRLATALQLRQQNLPTVPAVLSLEKQTNPFFRCDVAAVQQTASDYAGKTLTDAVEVFAAIRSWKDNF